MNTLVIIGWLLVTTPANPTTPMRAEATVQFPSVTVCAQSINSVLDKARAGELPGVNILDAGCDVTEAQ